MRRLSSSWMLEEEMHSAGDADWIQSRIDFPVVRQQIHGMLTRRELCYSNPRASSCCVS